LSSSRLFLVQRDSINALEHRLETGHELTHGFDDQGRQFDAKGNLHDWWTKADVAEFRKRADCVRDEYSQFTGKLPTKARLCLPLTALLPISVSLSA
jgi:hypothetical protein